LLEIVLFRHGIAEAYNLHGDSERELTKAGVKQIKQAAKGLKPLFLDRKRVVVFSSPLRRARQTADLLTETLKTKDRYLREEIADGRFEELYYEWAGYHDDTTIIVVGHEPTLGLWLTRMTSERLSFTKGAMCAIAVRDLLVQATGKLLWYCTAETLSRIDKNID
jgi:phosphohistidine phosphatase